MLRVSNVVIVAVYEYMLVSFDSAQRRRGTLIITAESQTRSDRTDS